MISAWELIKAKVVRSSVDPISGRIALLTRNVHPIEFQYHASVYGVVADGVALYDVTTTNSATCTISSATANFSQNDIGKLCTVLSYADSANTRVFGTIQSVSGTGTCVATLNGSPGVLSNAQFVYGTDDTVALQAAINAAYLHKGQVVLPGGIICISDTVVFKDGVTGIGVGRTRKEGLIKDFRYSGSSIVLLKNTSNGYAVKVGDASSGTLKYGAYLTMCNVDALQNAVNTTYVDTRSAIFDIASVRNRGGDANSHAVACAGSGARVLDSTIIGQENCHPLALAGDSIADRNVIIGAGNGYYGIKASNCDDMVISHNHIWKDAANSSMLGGSVWVNFYGANPGKGGVQISHNQFDTAFGPHILIQTQSGATGGRGVSIVGNISMNNDAVPNNTYPWLALTIAAGTSLRGLIVSDNLVRGSWNDATKGQHSYFIDGANIAGNVYASTVSGNVIDNLATSSAYNSFTPDYSAGNLMLVGVGTTPTAF